MLPPLQTFFYFMKVLNLYACLGGNRFLWDNCEVTAIELDFELARMYQDRFPNDTVIVTDAHQYLLDHYKEFDFIWSSPPCPTHSRARFARKETTTPEYPNMMLYQEIIFLNNWFNGKWVVENVIPYYEPLIAGKKIGRHLYWSNFLIPNFTARHIEIEDGGYKELEKFHKIDLSSYKGEQSKTKIARNLVDYEAGKIIFDAARNIVYKKNLNQTELF